MLCSSITVDEQATLVADRLIEAIGHPITVGRVTVAVGMSIGVAFHEPDQVHDPRLVDAADHALYEAKQMGKNRWIVATST